MPFFKNTPFNVNGKVVHFDLLFLHIPKTGGSSVEEFFSSLTNQALNHDSLFSGGREPVSYQHYTYEMIQNSIQNKEPNFENINLNASNLKIMTIVRNPNHRTMSAINHQLKPNMKITSYVDTERAEQEVDKFLSNKHHNEYDNHRLPQVAFFRGIEDKIRNDSSKFILLTTQHLTYQMQALGFPTFNKRINKGTSVDYDRVLTTTAKETIKTYYKNDWDLFLQTQRDFINRI